MTSDLSPLRIGVIGCGRVAREVHLRVLSTMPQVHVVALADEDETSLKSAQSLVPHAKTYRDAPELINDINVEAVLIATPNTLHASLAIGAFERGLHVYLEKPLALHLEDAQKVVQAWQKSNTVGAIGFNYRFNPLLQDAAKLIQSGTIGRVVGVRSSFCAPMHTAKNATPSWKTARASGGGVLLDLASHHIDSLRVLTGQDVASVWAQTRSMNCEDDTAWVQLQLCDGAWVQSFFSQSAVERDVWEFEGENGRLRVDRYNMTQPQITRVGELGIGAQIKRTLRGLHPSSTRKSVKYLRSKSREPYHEVSYRMAWHHFIAATHQTGQGDVPFATPHDGLRNLKVVLALEEAARAGNVVRL